MIKKFFVKNNNNFDWIAIDWGTTNFRAYFIKNDIIIKKVSTSDGIKNIKKNNFEKTLTKNLGIKNNLNDNIIILSCGMIGSQQGWIDTGYVKNLNLKNKNLVKVNTRNKKLHFFIVKGIFQKNPYDVIRGEETQISGFLSLFKNYSGYVCLPGTHSKWVKISKGKILNFKTFMTGEMYEMITTNSILKHSILEKKINLKVFDNSFLTSLKSEFNIFANLFEIRSRYLLSKKKYHPRSEILGYLIGSEIKNNFKNIKKSKVAIIGSKYNSKIYSRVLNLLKIENSSFNSSDITIQGLKNFYKRLKI